METSFPKNKIKVLLLEGSHPRGAELFETDGFTVECHAGAIDESALCDKLADAHLLGIRSRTQVTAKALEAADKLLAIGCFCIGTNQIDLPAAAGRGIPVFNAPFSNTRSVAELTIAEIIGLHRGLADRSREMHAGAWKKSAKGSHEIRGRTLGIIGYGRIGSQVSVLAEAMGMRVIYHEVRPVLPLGNAQPVALEELLEQADVVTLHVPATEQTDLMIGAEQLDRMKPGGYLINNARGNIVDLDALRDRLDSGRIAGAALDVFPEEPPTSDGPFDGALVGAPNVIMTPHIGGSTMEAQRAIAEDIALKLLRFVNNGSTSGAVNVPEVDLPEQTRAADQPRRHRVLHFHKNVPGVLSTLHAKIADAGANIAGEHLQTSGDLGYVVLDVDPTDGATITERLRDIPETIRVRLLW